MVGKRTELGRVDVRQLGSITVSTTGQLLLVIVVITRSQPDHQLSHRNERNSSQITENQFGNHDSLLLVHLYWDTLSVVHDGNLVLLSVDRDFDLVHGCVVNLKSARQLTGLQEEHTLLSAALTRISSKILKKPGTKVVLLSSANSSVVHLTD